MLRHVDIHENARFESVCFAMGIDARPDAGSRARGPASFVAINGIVIDHDGGFPTIPK
jgi:hypothetical protein